MCAGYVTYIIIYAQSHTHVNTHTHTDIHKIKCNHAHILIQHTFTHVCPYNTRSHTFAHTVHIHTRSHIFTHVHTIAHIFIYHSKINLPVFCISTIVPAGHSLSLPVICIHRKQK